MDFKYKCLMPPELVAALNQKFNIVGSIQLREVDEDWNILRCFFNETYKQEYSPLDRYVIQHQDTDVYIDECSVGLNFRNFFQIATELDIPFYTLIIWTNHIGIQKEVDLMCQHRHPADRPTVIESCCATKHVATADQYVDIDINEDKIRYHILSMMGHNRSHRFALYNSLQKIDSDKVAIAIKGKEIQ